jgi:uncharacterized surface protein with fasciclin (FAS1) repeats
MYHLTLGSYLASDLEDGELLSTYLELPSLGGDSQKINVSVEEDESLHLNGHVKIIEGDLIASNGIVHITNHALIPPPNLLIMAVHDFRYYAAFVFALKVSGLDPLVAHSFQSTVFGPTNEAFKKVPLKKLAYLFSSAGKSDLILLLLGHLSPVLVYADDIISHPGNAIVIPTLGKPIAVVVDGEGVDLNGGEASVVRVDTIASNGVLHGIDSVLGLDAISEDEGDIDRESDWYKAIFKTEE